MASSAPAEDKPRRNAVASSAAAEDKPRRNAAPTPRLTRAGVALATAGLALLGLGMALGNLELLLLGVFPLLLVAFALARQPRADPTGARRLSTRTPRRGDAVDVELSVRTPAGTDLVEVHSPLPAGVALEEGTNLLMTTRTGALVSRFRLRAHGRGRQELGAVQAWALDPTGLVGPRASTLAPAETLEVTPRSFRAERLRAARQDGRRLPDLREARSGALSTDFRELRDYAWGDPPKSINWKATARRFSSLAGHGAAARTPLVNEYEREGRRAVLVLLDGGPALRVGTTRETGLDHGVEAALGVASLFLQRGARVGAAVYNAKANPPAPPEAGPGQHPQVEKALAASEADPAQTPQKVLQQLQGHLAGMKPSLVVVTRLTPETAHEVAELADRVRALLRERHERLPLHVVDVRALALVPHEDDAWGAAAAVVEREDEASARIVREAGARVVAWRPGEEDLRQALARRGWL